MRNAKDGFQRQFLENGFCHQLAIVPSTVLALSIESFNLQDYRGHMCTFE